MRTRAVLEWACALPSLRASFLDVGPVGLDDGIMLADKAARLAQLSPR